MAKVKLVGSHGKLSFRIEDHKIRLAPGFECSRLCVQAGERSRSRGHPAGYVIQREAAPHCAGPYQRAARRKGRQCRPMRGRSGPLRMRFMAGGQGE